MNKEIIIKEIKTHPHTFIFAFLGAFIGQLIAFITNAIEFNLTLMFAKSLVIALIAGIVVIGIFIIINWRDGEYENKM